MTNLNIDEPEDEDDEISDEMEFFLKVLAHPGFNRSEFDNSLKELQADPDEDITDCSYRLQ